MAYAKKDTFWNKQRVEKGLTLKEISELVGEKEKTVSAYFTGFLMPSDSTIKTLCDLFDVDFHTGNLEFQHAHRDYVGEHDLTLKCSSKKKGKKELNSEEDVLDALYGVLSCKEFIDIYNAFDGYAGDTTDARRILYSKVDYDTYNRIIEILEESKVEF